MTEVVSILFSVSLYSTFSVYCRYYVTLISYQFSLTQSLQPSTLNFPTKYLAHRKIDYLVYMRPQHLYYIIYGP